MKKLILLIFVLTVACTEQERPPEISILEMSSCELPCWNDIVAGQTTEVDLLQILTSLSIVDQGSIQNTHQPWSIFDDQINFSLREDESLNQEARIRGYVDVTRDIVSGLMMCGEMSTSVGDIVQATGEPESILSGDLIEQPGRLVILINSRKGISYWYTAQKSRDSHRYEITSDASVGCVYMFDPDLYEELLDAKLLSSGHFNAEETLKVMYPWNGYGDLNEKYPPRQP